MSAEESIDVVLCPAYLALRPMIEWTRDSRVDVYAQNMHYAPEGAFTGEVSAPMLREAGVQGVIVGHSERRQLFAESDAAVQLKVAAAVAAGLVPILCVEESEEQCQLGETEHRLCQQLRSGLALVDTSRLGDVVIAYEPIWTIGTGGMAALEHTQEVGALVRGVVAERSSEQATRTRVLYGGSVSADTSATLLALDDVDGLLVGEPSLDANTFLSILNAVRS